MEQFIETINVEVLEKVDFFRDCWSYSSETHYTEDWEEEVINDYTIEIEFDSDGNILTSDEEIRNRVYEVAEGIVITYWLDI